MLHAFVPWLPVVSGVLLGAAVAVLSFLIIGKASRHPAAYAIIGWTTSVARTAWYLFHRPESPLICILAILSVSAAYLVTLPICTHVRKRRRRWAWFRRLLRWSYRQGKQEHWERILWRQTKPKPHP